MVDMIDRVNSPGFIPKLLIKKSIPLSKKWALTVGQPRYAGSPGPEALPARREQGGRPTLSAGVLFSCRPLYAVLMPKPYEKNRDCQTLPVNLIRGRKH
jgi:hypothetical protein